MKDAEKEDYVLNERFKEIYNVLKSKYKVKEVIEKLKFSGSRQLYNILEDKNLVSSRAVSNLIKNFNVNPSFIFSGNGNMKPSTSRPFPNSSPNTCIQRRLKQPSITLRLLTKVEHYDA